MSAAAALGFLSFIFFIVWLLADEKTSRPNGTRPVRRLNGSLPLIGDTLSILRNTHRFHDWVYEICSQHRGEPVLVKALGRPDIVVMCSTEAFEECLKNEFDNFPKGPFQCSNLADVLGGGIFAVDHAKWVHQRKTASNLFTAQSIRDSMAVTVRKHTITLRRIFQQASDSGAELDLFRLFHRFTIEAFSEIGFGIHMNCLEADEEHPFQAAFDSAERVLVRRFVRPSWFWKLQRLFGVGDEGILQQNMKVIDMTVLDIIAKSLERRRSGEKIDGNARDIVSLFLDHFENSADSKTRAFNPQYLRDIVVNFLFAGRDTTAQALSWFSYNISQHPRVVTKIREELRQQLPGLFDGSLATPTVEQVASLSYLEAALRETLRLHPLVPFTTKHVEKDIVLSDGTFLAKGSNIGLPSWALGRMTIVWGEDASQFKPERFIDPKTNKVIFFPPSKFVAFNSGPRTCIGQNLAMLEMKIVMASLLSRFDLRLVPEQHVTYDFSLTLPMRGKLLAHITSRR